MALAETSFLVKISDGKYQLRWFTPTLEVDLCGHATLAAAHALWVTNETTSSLIEFETKSGKLTCCKR
eukprot:gene11129-19710_t